MFSDVPPVPVNPTEAEQDEHHATGHAAYRSLCEHCVKGRGRASPHAVVSERELPEIGVDCASETDFGQTYFGHPHLTDLAKIWVADFGQADFGQF